MIASTIAEQRTNLNEFLDLYIERELERQTDKTLPLEPWVVTEAVEIWVNLENQS